MALLLIMSVFAGVAFELLSQAARMGHAGGMIGLAQLYESGVQTPGKKTALFEPFIYKNQHFTKTGSGRT
jgi:TPR repeat protein